MTKQTRTTLKATFETGDVPTQAQFEDLIDSGINQTDDSLSEETNSVDCDKPFGLKSYTVATLPTGVTGAMIYVSDHGAGAQPFFYNGTNWVAVSDLATAAV